MTRFLLVCLAGGLGSGARWLVVMGAERLAGATFPWGVLAVNVVGSFAIALVAALAAGRLEMSPLVRLTITTGFLGGFTTYSSFNQGTLDLLNERRHLAAGAYVGITLLACLAAGWLGLAAGRR